MKTMTPDKFLEVALSQVGYKETSNNKTKYGKWYGMDGQPWCAMFVSWCANEVGVLNKLIPKYASSSEGYKWFKNNTGITLEPKRGYIGFLKNEGSNKRLKPAEHTFIVYDVDSEYITTIEGNIDNRVVKLKRKISDSKILGFGIVKWDYNKVVYKYVDNVDYEGLNVRYASNGAKTGKLLQQATRVEVIKFVGNRAYLTEATYVDKKYLVDSKPSYKVVTGADSDGLNVRPMKSKTFKIMGKPIACIKNGTRVKVYEIIGNWARVSPNDNAWCYKYNLQ